LSGYEVLVDATKVNESLRRLGGQQGQPLRDSLRGVIEACVQLFSVTGSGLMIADEQSILRYAVATDGPGRVLEEVQLETGEGPCVDTFVKDAVTVTEDLATDDRWPRVAERVAGLGVHGMIGVPVRLGGVTVASLDVYVDTPHQWDRTEQRALVRYGEVISALTETALAAQQAGELADQLNYALDHRVPIERGIGYLMSRDGVDHAAAFNRLRRAARSSRRRIGDVAEELLRAGRLPDEGH
jgi:transcriptional regulator with GAF, ATPase, and Fis domain